MAPFGLPLGATPMGGNIPFNNPYLPNRLPQQLLGGNHMMTTPNGSSALLPKTSMPVGVNQAAENEAKQQVMAIIGQVLKGVLAGSQNSSKGKKKPTVQPKPKLTQPTPPHFSGPPQTPKDVMTQLAATRPTLSPTTQDTPRHPSPVVQPLPTLPVKPLASEQVATAKQQLGNLAIEYDHRNPGSGYCARGVIQTVNKFLEKQGLATQAARVPSGKDVGQSLLNTGLFREVPYDPNAEKGTIHAYGPRTPRNANDDLWMHGHSAIAGGNGWEHTDSRRKSSRGNYAWAKSYEYIGPPEGYDGSNNRRKLS